MFDLRYLCVVGIILIIFGLWLHATIYWDLRNAPAFKKKLEDLALKNKKDISFGDRVNLNIPRFGKKIAKVSTLSGLIIVFISCISKMVF
ncbi:hypothetical protein [Sulfurovum sp. AR]|uniref:hypothetical protein n=1 Tax=Sulfurovum sp. AR TaxID=1165841 RepID=UPI00025C4C87|nr:hypothetical protein [Sulfurovum sp. AR]EIF51995.1 sortase [Sulfurovum sp. AR]